MAVINPDIINLECAGKCLIFIILLLVFASASTNISRHLASCKRFGKEFVVNASDRFFSLSLLMNVNTETTK